jgi:hypothetical protein
MVVGTNLFVPRPSEVNVKEGDQRGRGRVSNKEVFTVSTENINRSGITL